MDEINKISKKKKIAIFLVLFFLILLVVLRFVPISTKYKYCANGGEYRIIKGELDNYINSPKGPAADELYAMGACSSKSINLYVI